MNRSRLLDISISKCSGLAHNNSERTVLGTEHFELDDFEKMLGRVFGHLHFQSHPSGLLLDRCFLVSMP